MRSGGRRGVRSWFLPSAPRVLELLVDQGERTVAGMEAFERWAAGEPAAGAEVRAAEHAADDLRRAATAALRRAFVTPVEPEDLFSLSERLDRVMNQAKDLVREAEVLDMAPDEPIAQMAKCALNGVRCLVRSFPLMERDAEGATAAADEAIRNQRAIEHVYRDAMAGLVVSSDPGLVAGKRELYRRCARIGDAIEHVADRVWYAVVKLG